ncbi:7218_t:CDS:1, partial [Paraglomus brasilianum]
SKRGGKQAGQRRNQVVARQAQVAKLENALLATVPADTLTGIGDNFK